MWTRCADELLVRRVRQLHEGGGRELRALVVVRIDLEDLPERHVEARGDAHGLHVDALRDALLAPLVGEAERDRTAFAGAVLGADDVVVRHQQAVGRDERPTSVGVQRLDPDDRFRRLLQRVRRFARVPEGVELGDVGRHFLRLGTAHGGGREDGQTGEGDEQGEGRPTGETHVEEPVFHEPCRQRESEVAPSFTPAHGPRPARGLRPGAKTRPIVRPHGRMRGFARRRSRRGPLHRSLRLRRRRAGSGHADTGCSLRPPDCSTTGQRDRSPAARPRSRRTTCPPTAPSVPASGVSTTSPPSRSSTKRSPISRTAPPRGTCDRVLRRFAHGRGLRNGRRSPHSPSAFRRRWARLRRPRRAVLALRPGGRTRRRGRLVPERGQPKKATKKGASTGRATRKGRIAAHATSHTRRRRARGVPTRRPSRRRAVACGRARLRSPAPDGRYGLAGAAVEATKREASAWVEVAAPSRPSRLRTSKAPRGGSFDLFVDGARTAHVATRAAATASAFRVLPLALGPHHSRPAPRRWSRAPLRRRLRRRRGRGSCSTRSASTARASPRSSRGSETHLQEQLRHRAPALVVFAYGTNEADDDRPIADYEAAVGEVLARVGRAVPDSACLLVGPPDRAVKSSDGWITPPRLFEVIAAQQRAAAAGGCAYYDQLSAMGGPGTMAAMGRRRTTRAGGRIACILHAVAYAILGQTLAGDLLRGYQGFRADRGQVADPGERLASATPSRSSSGRRRRSLLRGDDRFGRRSRRRTGRPSAARRDGSPGSPGSRRINAAANMSPMTSAPHVVG